MFGEVSFLGVVATTLIVANSNVILLNYNLTTYKARSYIYIYIYLFIFVPVWQKNNMSVTPVSQANCQNFCPISSLGFTKAYQWIKG